MARNAPATRTASKKSRKSGGSASTLLETMWKLVEDNPQVALAIAFAIGALVSEASKPRGNVKKLLLKQIAQGAGLLPQLLAGANKLPSFLKILVGPALRAASVASGHPQPALAAARKRKHK